MALHGRPRSKGRRTATALGCVVAVLAVGGAAYQLGMDDAQRPRLQSLATPGQPTQLPALRFPAVPAVETSAQVLGPVQTVPSLRRAALRAAVTPAVSAPVLGPHVGLVVHDPTHGKQLLNLNGSDAFVPASTTKLFTVAAALAAIDPTTRFRTMVVSAGGSRRIVLTGGGDPLLARRTPPAGPTVDGYPQPATMARLATATARALDRRDVSSVRLGLDSTLFAGPVASPAWEPDYLYNVVSPITALWVDGGRAAGSSERSRDPVLAAGAAFEAQLQRHGISVRGQPSAASAPANGQTLAFVESPPMAQIAEHILATSDNEAAEVLLRHVALASGRPASFTGGVTAVRQVLSRLGLELSRVRLYDGSGLSRHNRVPLRTLADLLDLATRQQELRPLLTGLPVAGFSGSLGYRFSADGTDAARGFVRAKTGTLSHVSLFAGSVRTASGTALTFALAADRVRLADTTAAREAMDRVASALAACDCR
ncbi:MAG TPA: D-alanyl-D-alanine carboxypeptidase/D-alanyl-D-alanine-endopeptidase [Nocardioidaceae bacterium]|nr:D-alanyl-D-alanine carboxypeptidase/D-alanyl-D-alanine-endopeptidase [Nocardioidaceae bacterium]